MNYLDVITSLVIYGGYSEINNSALNDVFSGCSNRYKLKPNAIIDIRDKWRPALRQVKAEHPTNK